MDKAYARVTTWVQESFLSPTFMVHEELSTVENEGSDEPQRIGHSWHPKLTLYRLLVLAAPIGLGIAKAVTSYMNFNYASITLEWITGVVVFIFLHVLGSYEDLNSPQLNWLFHHDYLEYLWDLLAIFGMSRPHYRSDEFLHPPTTPSRSLPITGYRILVTILVAFFGTLKSAFSYGNLQNDVTTVECVFGVGIITLLYYLSLYEDSAEKVYPLLFHVDFSPTLFNVIDAAGGATIITGKLLLCFVGLTASTAVSMAFFEVLKLTLNYRWYRAFFPEFAIVSLFTGFMVNFLMGFTLFSGVGAVIGVLFLTLRILFRSPILSRRRTVRQGFLFVQSVYLKYWDNSSSPGPGDRAFYLKRLLVRQAIKLPFNILTTFVVLFLLPFFFWLALMCAYVPAAMLQSYVPVTLTFPLLLFVSLPISTFISYVIVRDFYSGFLNFLSDVRNDYMDRGPLLPSH